MNTHSCIKCKVSYQDNDPDDYYCPFCNEERKRIAAEIDAKLANRPKKPVQSHFSPKDFTGAGGRIFFNSKDIL